MFINQATLYTKLSHSHTTYHGKMFPPLHGKMKMAVTPSLIFYRLKDSKTKVLNWED